MTFEIALTTLPITKNRSEQMQSILSYDTKTGFKLILPNDCAIGLSEMYDTGSRIANLTSEIRLLAKSVVQDINTSHYATNLALISKQHIECLFHQGYRLIISQDELMARLIRPIGLGGMEPIDQDGKQEDKVQNKLPDKVPDKVDKLLDKLLDKLPDRHIDKVEHLKSPRKGSNDQKEEITELFTTADKQIDKAEPLKSPRKVSNAVEQDILLEPFIIAGKHIDQIEYFTRPRKTSTAIDRKDYTEPFTIAGKHIDKAERRPHKDSAAHERKDYIFTDPPSKTDLTFSLLFEDEKNAKKINVVEMKNELVRFLQHFDSIEDMVEPLKGYIQRCLLKLIEKIGEGYHPNELILGLWESLQERYSTQMRATENVKQDLSRTLWEKISESETLESDVQRHLQIELFYTFCNSKHQPLLMKEVRELLRITESFDQYVSKDTIELKLKLSDKKSI